MNILLNPVTPVIIGYLTGSFYRSKQREYDDKKGKQREYDDKDIIIIIEYLEEDTQNQCSICLDYYKINSTKAILKCGHSFHKQCINNCKQNCPMCRTRTAL